MILICIAILCQMSFYSQNEHGVMAKNIDQCPTVSCVGNKCISVHVCTCPEVMAYALQFICIICREIEEPIPALAFSSR